MDSKQLTTMKEITGINVEIAQEQVLMKIGVKEGRKPSPRIDRCIRQSLQTVMSTVKPKAFYRTFPVSTSEERTYLAGKHVLKSRKLPRILRKCDKAIVFVTTLGYELDKKIEWMMSDRPHEGIILDTVASVAAESTTNTFQQQIDKKLDERKATTFRYSPGYCDWSIKEQKKIFNLLSGDSIGVTLSDDCLMSPRKSISGIMGIGLPEVVHEFGNACKECLNFSCDNRRS
jgi:hypothetical protein